MTQKKTYFMVKDSYWKIFVKDLVTQARVGILDSERKAPQKIIINIEAIINDNYVVEDNIETTVCYAELIEIAEKIIALKHYDLLETLANEIALYCLKQKRIASIKIRIEKPDIISNVTSVGIEVEQRR